MASFHLGSLIARLQTEGIDKEDKVDKKALQEGDKDYMRQYDVWCNYQLSF